MHFSAFTKRQFPSHSNTAAPDLHLCAGVFHFCCSEGFWAGVSGAVSSAVGTRTPVGRTGKLVRHIRKNEFAQYRDDAARILSGDGGTRTPDSTDMSRLL